jgi:hypothetical protein
MAAVCESHLCTARGSVYGDTLHQASWQRIQEIEAARPHAAEAVPTVFTKPQFTQPLQSVAVGENGTAILEARLIPVNDPHLKLEW